MSRLKIIVAVFRCWLIYQQNLTARQSTVADMLCALMPDAARFGCIQAAGCASTLLQCKVYIKAERAG